MISVIYERFFGRFMTFKSITKVIRLYFKNVLDDSIIILNKDYNFK